MIKKISTFTNYCLWLFLGRHFTNVTMNGSHSQDVDCPINEAAMESITLRFESLLSVSFAHVETASQALRHLKTQQQRLHLVSPHPPPQTHTPWTPPWYKSRFLSDTQRSLCWAFPSLTCSYLFSHLANMIYMLV